ncbi:MAG TPA: cytochrome b/b6 domain-containing protein [Alphaproteobacteria bacterium]|nr:cytochrome b/b6 domain-containing protein [Alphaproteobacteria bacterium]
MRAPNPGELRRVRVWDLPTRLFHWLIVALFGFSWWTSETDHLEWHKLSGYFILTLVLFRIYWGFAGSQTARFADFIHSPRGVVAYGAALLRRSGRIAFGHNPMGGWSVAVLLLLLLAQSVLGLFAVDIDGLDPGPLGNYVSFELGRRIAHWHGRVFNLLLLFSGLHVAVVLFYLVFKRQNLTAAMIVGTKRVGAEIVPPPLRFAPLWLALPGLAGAAGIVAWIVFGRF